MPKKVVTNAKALGDSLKAHGVRIVSGDTENHMVIVDLSKFGLTGRHAETALRDAGLTLNRNAIPFDPNGPWYTSGIRVGTPATTTLGMGPDEMKEIADIIVNVLTNTKPNTVAKTGQPSKAACTVDATVLERSRGRAKELLDKFPLYPELGEV